MPFVMVLEPFIGSKEENEKYANPQGVIPWAKHHPLSGRKLKQNVIELSDKRAKELSDLRIVKVLTASELRKLQANPVGLDEPKTQEAVDKVPTQAVDK